MKWISIAIILCPSLATAGIIGPSTLLTPAMFSQLETWHGSTLNIERIWDGSGNFDTVYGQGPTFVVIQADSDQISQQIIGGYHSQSWEAGTQNGTGDFIFNLTTFERQFQNSNLQTFSGPSVFSFGNVDILVAGNTGQATNVAYGSTNFINNIFSGSTALTLFDVEAIEVYRITPEPGTLTLCGISFVAFAIRRRRNYTR